MCVDYEDGHSYLRKDTAIRCWSGRNGILQVWIGLAFILFWAFLFPLIIYWRLKANSGKLDSTLNLKVYGIFYVGLNDDSVSWEILLMNIRKIILILVATFLSNTRTALKVILNYLSVFIGLHWDANNFYSAIGDLFKKALYRSPF